MTERKVPSEDAIYQAAQRIRAEDAGASNFSDPDGDIAPQTDKRIVAEAAGLNVSYGRLREELTDLAQDDDDLGRAEDELKYGK